MEANQTLALMGGDIALAGGTLKTVGGRIELGSVAAPGLVSLSSIEKGFSLSYEGISNFDVSRLGHALKLIPQELVR